MQLFMILTLAIAFTFSAATPVLRARSDDGLAGKWSGTFEGDSAGTFSMSFASGSDGLTGSIDVEFATGGGYSVPFKTIDVNGSKVALAYSAPGEGGDVQLEGELAGDAVTGTWQANDPGTGSPVAFGTFKARKQ
ncbi:MAG TPA: hypothetical protein VF198_08305 [Vicinamibacterales bacterium]